MNNTKQVKRLLFPLLFCCFGGAMIACRALQADSVAPPVSDNSVESEQKSFKLPDGLEVSLFASEKNGIANPVTMRWDPQGRLWVLCTWAYPQKKPAAKSNDKLLILTDTDGDGQADKTETYLDGLNMPMGFTFGDGGVYLAEGTRLLHYRDTDNDGKADTKRVLYTGFGTGDTHQNINSLAWTPGGELIFGQGNRVYSRVETVHGIIEGNSGTLWRYRPRAKRLESFMQNNSMSVNPWGYFFNRWGEFFAKCNDPQLVYAQPGMITTTNVRDMWRGGTKMCGVARSRGKSMIVEGIESSHFPDEYQGQILIAGYFVHNIDRFKLVQDGAGYKTERLQDFLATSHRSFRPVDIRTGPDGAIYIADWYNPIIGHYQADLHHPHRDKTHGRIWRITAKGRPVIKRPLLAGQPTARLLDHLKSKESYVRRQVKRMLFQAETATLIEALDRWVAELDPQEADYEHHLYEAIGLYESHETVRPQLLELLLNAEHPGARAYGARVVGRWHNRLPQSSGREQTALEMLSRSLRDQNARVRMEAIVSCAAIRDPRSMVVAAQALDAPRDRFIKHALVQATHSLKPLWEPALSTGELQFARTSHLAFVLQTAGGKNAIPLARGMLANPKLSANARASLLAMIAELGAPKDLQFTLQQAKNNASLLKTVLPALESAWRIRRQKPRGDLTAFVTNTLKNDKLPAEVHALSLDLAGAWQLKDAWPLANKYALSNHVSIDVRIAATSAMFAIDAGKAASLVDSLLQQDDSAGKLSGAVVAGLLLHDKTVAAQKGAERLAAASDETEVVALVKPFLDTKNGTKPLANALKGIPLADETKTVMLEQLASRGLNDTDLIQLLRSTSKETFKTPKHSFEFVQNLAKQVQKSGDRERGKVVFHSRVLGCVSCHESGSPSGEVGPDLSAIGAGMPVDRIIESVLWPEKEVKEGYDSTTLATDRGRVYSGYIRKEADGVVHLFDIASRKMIVLSSDSIDERTAGKTAMPENLVDALTKQQLLDVIKYLAERKGN